MAEECSKPQCRNPRYARTLCNNHYRQARRAGEIEDHEKATRTTEETIEEMIFLGFKPDGPILRQAEQLAPALGVKPSSVVKAWYRHRKHQEKRTNDQ